MPNRHDRYLLKAMVGPFALAIAGLVLFILLNVILSLSDLMVDRGIGMSTLLRLILYKVPSLLVVAVPMAALFAVFLGLGRLSHDREIMALESMGISLRRLLVPLILAATLTAGIDIMIYNWVVPASERAYQQTLRGIIFREGAPRITANTFFRGPDNQYFYIRRYDEDTGALHDVHIYDTTGQLFPAAKAQVTMITADEGVWKGSEWALEDGRVYGFDREGLLVFSGRYDSLSIPVDEEIADVLVRSRTPAEMSIGELRERMEQALRSGQRVDELVVEINQKVAIPAATIVFVLLGGAVTLLFNPRSRSGGIILGLVLVGVFQGLLWWTQTLGRRGVMNPSLAAWLPNLLFGALGLFVFLRVDRLAARDIWNRLRRFVPFLVILFAVGFAGRGNGLPLDLSCEMLWVSEDSRAIEATGGVRVAFEGSTLVAERLLLKEEQPNRWRIEATGSVELVTEETVTLRGDGLTAVYRADETYGLEGAQAEGLSGHSAFVNSAGEEQTIYFDAERGEVRFDDEGELERLDAYEARLTTCDCCGVGLAGQPYSLEADRLILYADRLLVAYGLTARLAGIGVLWLPVYVQPLEGTLDNPLFPAIGQSGLRGWFVKWNVPFFVSEYLYGTIRADLYSRHAEIGLGATVNYEAGVHRGVASVYEFPAVVGDSESRIRFEHRMALDGTWNGVADVAFTRVGDEESFSYGASLDGSIDGWRIALNAEREISENDEEPEITEIVERIPEISVTAPRVQFGRIGFDPSVGVGRVIEMENDRVLAEAFRAEAGLYIAVDPLDLLGFRLTPRGAVRATTYETAAGADVRRTVSGSVTAAREGISCTLSTVHVYGESPLTSDFLESSQAFSWNLSGDGRLRLSVRGRLDLDEMVLDPVDATVAWGEPFDGQLAASWNPTIGRLASAVVSGEWSGLDGEFSLRVPWDGTTETLGRIALDVQRRTDRIDLEVDLAIEAGRVAIADAAAEVPFAETWGATGAVRYSQATGEQLTFRYGLYTDVGGCLRFGVERSGVETWLYASVLAFPEAILRYAPETARFDVGT